MFEPNYFAPETVYYPKWYSGIVSEIIGKVKVWTGNAWKVAKVKVWGGTWEEKEVKIFNGSEWN